MTDDNRPTAMEERGQADDARQTSPSVARNKDPILEVLRPHLSAGMSILEIASGTGEHAVHIMSNVNGLDWQPSDLSPEARKSVHAWANFTGLDGLRPPIELDASLDGWAMDEAQTFDGIICINMIHIAPFEAAKGVIRGAGERLKSGGFLFFYGPYKKDGRHTAPSNEAFDESLKSRDASWGLRDMEEIETLAVAEGLKLEAVTPMPSNNFSLLFRTE